MPHETIQKEGRVVFDAKQAQIMLWALIASAAGAITALSFRPFATMSKTEILLSLFVGTAFSFFVSPIVGRSLIGKVVDTADMQMMGGLFYLMASGSNIFIPTIVKRLNVWLGSDRNGQ